MILEEFIVKAKINTYASSGEGGEKSLEDGSKELVYEEGEWKYQDRYFGFSRFIGEEVVWKGSEVIWGMNYYGAVVETTVSVKIVYEFLKKALRCVKQDRPFRGPKEFSEGELGYIDDSSGTVNDFTGNETIYWRGEKVYELKYHGGMIK